MWPGWPLVLHYIWVNYVMLSKRQEKKKKGRFVFAPHGIFWHFKEKTLSKLILLKKRWISVGQENSEYLSYLVLNKVSYRGSMYTTTPCSPMTAQLLFTIKEYWKEMWTIICCIQYKTTKGLCRRGYTLRLYKHIYIFMKLRFIQHSTVVNYTHNSYLWVVRVQSTHILRLLRVCTLDIATGCTQPCSSTTILPCLWFTKVQQLFSMKIRMGGCPLRAFHQP